MEMKRLILSVWICLSAVLSLQASRALSVPTEVVQPDGSRLTITAYGDEHHHWVQTTDGVLVVRRDGGYYVAKIDAQSSKVDVQHSTLLAHNPGQRSEAEQQACHEQLQGLPLYFQRAEQTASNRRAQVTGSGYFPHKDSPKALVILANFKDVKFSIADAKKSFEQYFMGETQQAFANNEDKNFVGVRKYFEASSHGLFTPSFDVVGPVELSNDMEYYGADNPNNPDDVDVNFTDFCKECISLVDDDVDFKQYDNNGDGKAEMVCIIYAGYGQNTNPTLTNTIWAKCGARNISTKDNVTVNYVNCSAELFRESAGTDINGIGVFVHELSHGMGLPDIYATTTAARQVDNQSMEFWDLMDYGEYANNGYAPVPYNAWEQEAMGWITVEQLTTSTTITDMLPLVQGGKAYKFGNGANQEEFFFLENVQARNNETGQLGFSYGHGLLVYHVAYASNRVNMGDYPNNTAGKPRVAVVPADGLLISGYRFGDGKPYTQQDYINSLRGDPFPGTNEVMTLTAEQQLPNYIFYNGDPTPIFCLTDIKEDGKSVSFSFWDSELTGIETVHSSQFTVHSSDQSVYDLQGRKVNVNVNDNDQHSTFSDGAECGVAINVHRSTFNVKKGVYIVNGQKVVIQ